MRHLSITSIFLLVFVWSNKVFSQHKQYQTEHTIVSAFLQETRTFRVNLPKSYYDKPGEKYPVLYVLDGQRNEKPTLDIYDFLSKSRYIPEMIIVSVPHTGRRSRDYNTFFRNTEKVNKGADRFLDFIEKEVIKTVAQQYRASAYRMLSGHSNSGLFVIHSLIKKPALFRARFAFSPSSHHIPAQRRLLKQFLQGKPQLSGYFYSNVGGVEFYKMTNAFAEVKQIFEQYNPSGLRCHFDFEKVDGHRATSFTGMYTAFKKLYAPWRLSITRYAQMSVADVQAHFSQLSTEFGLKIMPKQKELTSMGGYYSRYTPNLQVIKKLKQLLKFYYPKAKSSLNDLLFCEKWLAEGRQSKQGYKTLKPGKNLLNNWGYTYLRKQKSAEAIYLFKLAVSLYPASANTYDSLGEALESTGDMSGALKMYTKAHQTAKGKKEKTAYARNIKRVRQKLK